jgi:hypothetical protein
MLPARSSDTIHEVVGESVIETRGDVATTPTGSRELLLRVAGSVQFQKSKRLRELLVYLGDRALHDPNCNLHEQEIGVEVLGRPPDYDTSHDTLVRVQISHLRRKLQEYFTSEGRDEPLIIDIPKGQYVPVFRLRAEAPPEVEPKKAVALPLKPALIGIAIGLSLMGAVWGGFDAVKYRVEARSPEFGTERPSVDALWSQLFGNAQATYLVLSDVTLLDFENLIGRSVPLSEYEAHEFDRLAAQFITDPIRRTLAKEAIDRVTTSVSDVQVARDFGVLAAGARAELNVISARDLSSPLLSSQNVILLGSWRANPWVGLFEDRMAFQTDYQETPSSVRFINRAPLADEPATFQAEWRRYGYCRVTYMPNTSHTGNVLLISGSDVISTQAGGRYVTSEESILALRQKLRLKAGDAMPHFEVLLQTRIINSTVPSFELVAYRPH